MYLCKSGVSHMVQLPNLVLYVHVMPTRLQKSPHFRLELLSPTAAVFPDLDAWNTLLTHRRHKPPALLLFAQHVLPLLALDHHNSRHLTRARLKLCWPPVQTSRPRILRPQHRFLHCTVDLRNLWHYRFGYPLSRWLWRSWTIYHSTRVQVDHAAFYRSLVRCAR